MYSWSHADLATLDVAGITSEMKQLETAHLAIIGKAPRCMRPPFLSTNQQVQDTLKSLGYLIVEVDNDTQDWDEGPKGEIELSIEWYKSNLTEGRALSLNHDPFQATAEDFGPAIISYLEGLGLKCEFSFTLVLCATKILKIRQLSLSENI